MLFRIFLQSIVLFFGTAYLTNKNFRAGIDGAVADLVNGVIEPTIDAIMAKYSMIGMLASTAVLYVVNLYHAATSKQSGKEKASDAPSWAKSQRPNRGEKAKDFAKRMLDAKYGEGNWPKGARSEYSQITKWAQRSLGLK